MKTNNKGFSLVELIVVIAIMAILAAVAIPTFAGFITKANVAADVSFVSDLTYAAELAHAASSGDVTNVEVIVDANGEITGATYKVGEVTVTIAKAQNATEFSATALNPAVGGQAATPNTTVQNAADDTIDAVDWDYTFKHYKDNTYSLSDDSKALE